LICNNSEIRIGVGFIYEWYKFGGSFFLSKK
jgi:hypothetical protein